MTLNIHSHFNRMSQSELLNYIVRFVDYIVKENVEVIALQECSQTHSAKKAEGGLPGFFLLTCNETVIREDNCAYLIAKELEKKGLKYYWTWTGAKFGYDIYDEGLALFSIAPVLKTEEHYISQTREYSNWKTRKVIGMKILCGEESIWFYSVHMGWWKDKEEPFKPQFLKLHQVTREKENVFLMGDFNSRSDVRGEGYDLIKKLGWLDTYNMAEDKGSGITVPGKIDGWKDAKSGMRIDYIWTKKKRNIIFSKVIFDGNHGAVISDHFGIMIAVE